MGESSSEKRTSAAGNEYEFKIHGKKDLVKANYWIKKGLRLGSKCGNDFIEEIKDYQKRL